MVNVNRRRTSPAGLGLLLSWLVFALLLLYTYQELFQAPYLGFNFNPSTGRVQWVYVNRLVSDLQVDDELVAVDSLLLSEWKNDLRQPLFESVEPEEVLSLEILRDGQVERIDWQVAGFNRDEFRSRLLNNWWIGYIFWLAGTATLLLVRPKNTLYWLLSAFFLLTAIWLVVGNTSRWGLWESAIVYRIAILLLAPVCLHLHWLFPHPLAKLPKISLWAGYLAFVVLSVLQWFELIPASAAILILVLAFVSGLCLLITHLIRQPEQRNKVKFLLLSFAFAMLPFIGVGIAALFNAISPSGPIALLALPIIPIAYFFSVYRYQLGTLELRANRMIALYLFLVVFGSGIIAIAAIMAGISDVPGEAVSINLAIGLLSALIGALTFPSFVRFVERYLLAIPLPPIGLLDTYIAQIITSLTKPDLVQLLSREILPSLLIRQSALLHLKRDQEVIYCEGVEEQHLLILPEIHLLFVDSDVYRASALLTPRRDGLAWVHLGLPLRFEGELIGVWLFGRRDPDDIYAQAEITVLQTLAHQTAIALVNVEQTALLKILYQGDVDRSEVARARLAHTLHDEVLNQIGLIYTSLEAACLSDQFVKTYQSIKQQVRRMITDLRPAMLDFGLYRALEEFVVHLDERHDHSTMVLMDIAISDPQIRYPLRVEEYLFRIIQQACENSLQHARPALIGIQGTMSSDLIDIMVEDDGVGFSLDTQSHLSHLLADLLANKHFGLVGMYERAATIQAKLLIRSAPEKGTRVRVIWSAEPSSLSSIAISEESH